MPEAPRGRHGGSVAEAREALASWVDAAGGEGRTFLQVLLRRTPRGYALCHHEDAGAPAGQLERETDPHAARLIAQTTASGAHRPLKTAPNLRRGWLLEELDTPAMWTALDYLYPACAVHWHAGRMGTLEVTPWSDTAARQSGMYASVRLLPPAVAERAVRACCARAVCLREVEWPLSRGLQPATTGPADRQWGDARVPCPEACSLFISLARQLLQVEREPRTAVAGIGELSASESEQLRHLGQDDAGGAQEGVREGEFENPLNLRRLRYLAARLEDAEVA